MKMVEIRRASDDVAKFINIDFKAVVGGFILLLLSLVGFLELRDRERMVTIQQIHTEAIDVVKDDIKDLKGEIQKTNEKVTETNLILKRIENQR